MTSYPFTLPPLDYKLYALQPFISPFLIHTHYYRHHKTYIDKLNELLKINPNLQNRDLTFIILNSKGKIFNNACQHFNHSFFWKSLSPTVVLIPSPLREKIIADFKSIEGLKNLFIEKSNAVFGSGYTWIVFDPSTKKLNVVTTKDAYVPIIDGQLPLINLDLWEHAYYLDYTFQRDKFISHFWDHINWNFANQMYELILNKNLKIIT